MDIPSSLSLLLRGYDQWVIKAKPSCEDATRVLRALQRAAAQTKCVRDQVPSIPLLMRAERFGRSTDGPFRVSALPADVLLF